MSTTTILQARRITGLKQHEIARPLQKTVMWLSLVERGLLPLDPETEARILTVIRRLAQLNEVVAEQKQRLVKDFAVR